MDDPENPVDMNRSASETAKLVESHSSSSTSRYGRARKPKCFFQDFYNTDEVVKRGTKSDSPKTQKRTKSAGADDFIHVTGDADVVPKPFVKTVVETTEDNFDNFMKTVSGQPEDVKPVETTLKERKFFKSTKESKLQASTISYISKVAPKQAAKTIDLMQEVTEPELDVNKVIKIVTKPTEAKQPSDTQKSQKGTVKTYGNKRKSTLKADVFETFSLPDKPFIKLTTTDPSKILKSAKTSDIDVVINTEDKNQINMDNKNSNAITFFGVKLSPEKPRDIFAIESASSAKVSQKAPPKLITSVTRIGKVQSSSVAKINKSVLSRDTTKKIFASVPQENILTIVPKTACDVPKINVTVGQTSESMDLTTEQLLIPVKSPLSPDMATVIPTCKIKSITSVCDPTNVNNNNQEKKFVKVVMDKSKILKMLPTSGRSPIKLSEMANTSSESDKSDSIASPPYSPIKPKLIPKVPIPSVINISKPNVFTGTSSTSKLSTDSIKPPPRIIASPRYVRKEFKSPMSPVKVIGLSAKDSSVSPVKVPSEVPKEILSIISIVDLPSKESLSPSRAVLLSPKRSPSGEVVARKRKQDLILRKESDHSYSISPPNRTVLPVPPKKKFMARMRIGAIAQKNVPDIEIEDPPVILKDNIAESKKDTIEVKDDAISEQLLGVTTNIVEDKEILLSESQEKIVVPDTTRSTIKKDDTTKSTTKKDDVKESIEDKKDDFKESIEVTKSTIKKDGTTKITAKKDNVKESIEDKNDDIKESIEVTKSTIKKDGTTKSTAKKDNVKESIEDKNDDIKESIEVTKSTIKKDGTTKSTAKKDNVKESIEDKNDDIKESIEVTKSTIKKDGTTKSIAIKDYVKESIEGTKNSTKKDDIKGSIEVTKSTIKKDGITKSTTNEDDVKKSIERTKNSTTKVDIKESIEATKSTFKKDDTTKCTTKKYDVKESIEGTKSIIKKDDATTSTIKKDDTTKCTTKKYDVKESIEGTKSIIKKDDATTSTIQKDGTTKSTNKKDDVKESIEGTKSINKKDDTTKITIKKDDVRESTEATKSTIKKDAVKESIEGMKKPLDREKSASPIASLVDKQNSPVVLLTQLDWPKCIDLNKPLESTSQIINKPLETVAKNVVRVSPRKGKGTNAFLWETNSGVFFIKQAKGKATEEVKKDKDEDLIDASEIKTVEEVVELDKGDGSIKEGILAEVKVQSSSSFKEEQLEEGDDVVSKGVVKTLKVSPIIKKRQDLRKVQQIFNKTKRDVKMISNKSKPKRFATKSNAKDITMGRQLRTRKFIFAEQIISTNRKTIAKVLDKTPIPSRDNANVKSFGRKKLLRKRNSGIKEIELVQNVEVKRVVDNKEAIKTGDNKSKHEEVVVVNVEKRISKLIEIDTSKENIKIGTKRSKKMAIITQRKPEVSALADQRNTSPVETVVDRTTHRKKSVRAKRSTKQTEPEQLNEDVILIPNQKKIIEINSDDESGDSIETPKLSSNQPAKEQKPESKFVMKTEIKKEKVTPDKKKVVARVNVRKRKRRPGRSRNHIRKLQLLNEQVQEPEEVGGQGKLSVPMPMSRIPVEMDNKLSAAEVKEEKMDEGDGHVEKELDDDSVKLRSSDTGKILNKECSNNKYNEGDMVWAKVGCHPYWPAMIAKDPTKNSIKQNISSKLNKIPYYHVRYFADNGRRSWIRATALMYYKRENDLEVMVNSTPSANSKKFRVPKLKYPLWKIAVEELESIKDSQLSVKRDFFTKAALRGVKKKQSPSPRLKGIKREKPDDYYSSPNVSYKTLSSTRKIPIPVPEVKTPTSSRAQRLSSVDTLNKDSPRSHIDRFLQTQHEDKINWKKTRSRSVDDEQSKLDSDIQRLKDFDTTDCSSSETDSIHHKIPASGPIPVSAEYQELLLKRNNLFRKVTRDKVCEICFKPGNILSCRGPCNGLYHLECANGYLDESSNPIAESVSLQLSTKSYKRTTLSRLRKNRGTQSETNSSNGSDVESKKSSSKDKKNSKGFGTFICGSCDRNDHCVCFVCYKEVSPRGDRAITKCKVAKCGKAYHKDCTRLWPQVQWLEKPSSPSDPDSPVVTSVVCPRHVCHICVSDDPKAASARACRSEAVVRCLLCPATYHATTACIPAGTEIYTHSQVICPRHLTLPDQANSLSSVFDNSNQVYSVHEYYTKPLQTINTTWCFICSNGGTLICCERCPTSVHETCSPIICMDDGNYICEDCETGRLILYDEVVWVKLGSYRWWPALVLYPKDVPINVRTMRHRRGEFVIKFFGSYDHHWMGQGRAFLYQDGDKAPTYSARNVKSLDVAFAKAIEEAAEAFKLKRDFKKSLLQSDSRQPKSLKPPPYIKIRYNKPVGTVKVYDGNISITTPCSCDPKADSPCGPNTNCINRLLWTECNPRNCPAGERCQNQLFETRQYPPLVPYKTDGRGWGLKTLVPIAAGQFLIEYVGEVIEEQEYKRRVANMQNQAEMNYYFLTIDSDRIIDAGPKGNVARFMNHSCSPNCETQKWTVNGDTRVGLFAIENIPANKELTFNYNLAPNGKALLECKCKAVGCSGFIGVKKATENPKVKVLSEKLLLKKKKRLAKSNRLKNKNLLDRTCFICDKSGKLITCSNLSCSETYHIECVELMNVPYAFWRCPRHYCNVCRRNIVKRCRYCINSYCLQHCNIKTIGKIIEFVCPAHKNASPIIKEEIEDKNDIVREGTPKNTIENANAEPSTVSAVPKEVKLEIDKNVAASNKKVKAKSLKAIKKISPINKNIRKTRNQIKSKLPTKRQLRQSR